MLKCNLCDSLLPAEGGNLCSAALAVMRETGFLKSRQDHYLQNPKLFFMTGIETFYLVWLQRYENLKFGTLKKIVTPGM